MPKAKAKSPTLLDRMSNAAIKVALEPFLDGTVEFEALRPSGSFHSWSARRDGFLLSLWTTSDPASSPGIAVNHDCLRIFTAELVGKNWEAVINYGERRVATTFSDGELLEWANDVLSAAKHSPDETFAFGGTAPSP